MFNNENVTEHCKEKTEFSESCGTEREDCHLEPFFGWGGETIIPYST